MNKFWMVTLVVLGTVHCFWGNRECEEIKKNYATDVQTFDNSEGYDCLARIRKEKAMPNFTIDKSFSPDEERQVLVDLYNSTNGHKWCNNSGWLNPSVHHCSWYGITCHYNTSYVKSIQLAFNNLDGFLPSSIWRIRNLLALCPSDNKRLQGQMKDFIFSNMSKLLSLSLRGTQLNGIIPGSIVELSYLQTFLACDLYGEMLSGPLPQDIGNMTELRCLCLAGGNFTGTLPRSISRLTKLIYLNIIQNQPGLLFTGHMEDVLSSSFNKLDALVISGISLKGNLRDSLPPKLRLLSLVGNNISGNLPLSFRNITGLSHLSLANNHLKGNIPGELLASKDLSYLDLSNNNFNSLNKNASFESLRNKGILFSLSLAGNRNIALNFRSFLDFVTGSLFELDISSCDIKAELPQKIWRVGHTLSLRNNRFYGNIKFIATDSLIISSLDVSNNNLSGPIPSQTYSSATNLKYLDITGNPLMEDGKGATDDYMNPSFVVPDFTNMIKTNWRDNFTCPQGRFSFNDGRVILDPSYYGYRFCTCDEGYYGLSGFCQKCMLGGTCRTRKNTRLSNISMVMKEGFWPGPEPDNVSRLVQCHNPKACNPSGNCECWLELNVTKDRVKRTGYHVTKCNKECLCSQGNTDRFCSRCLPGFYKIGGLCHQCDEDKTNIYVILPILALSILVILWAFFGLGSHRKISFAVVALEFVLMFLFMMLEYVPSWAFQVDLIVFVFCLTSKGKSLHTVLSIAIFYFQTLDSMIGTVHSWPEQMQSAQHYISSIWNLHFSALSCDFPQLFTPVGKLAFVLLLPFLGIAFTWLYYLSLVIYSKYTRNNSQLRERNFTCRKISILILNVVYFPVVESTITVLAPCVRDGSIAYLRETPWVECSSTTYKVLHSIGVCSLVFYVLGIPFLIFLPLLLIHRKNILGNESADLDSWLGSIYLSYKSSYRSYFEMVVILRRLLLAFSFSFIDSSSAVQTLAVCSILTAAAVIQLLLKPYKPANERFPCENVMETLVLVVLAKSFMISRFIVASQESESVFFIWLFIGINFAVVAGILGVVLVSVCCRGRFRARYDSQEDILNGKVLIDSNALYSRLN